MNQLNIHTRLKLARKELQLNQLEIANELDIQQKTISEIENGKIINIPNTYIYYFYKKGISLDWIYDGKGEMLTKQNSSGKNKLVENLPLSELFNEVKQKTISDQPRKQPEIIVDSKENISLYERLIESKDVTIRSLLAYVKSQENNLDFVKELVDRKV